MMVEDDALEAVVAGEIQVPGDLYVGANVEPRHVAEFFYRAGAKNLLAAGETPLAIFDCIILERDGRRLGGLTLHDYAVVTDQHLITWGRGLNKDIVDHFPWNDITLAKFGRRNPFEGVIKFNYMMKPVGQKRRISLRNRETEVSAQTDAPKVGTALYLDLMPAEEVRVCVEMMHYFTRNSGATASAAGFKSQFQADILRSQERTQRVNFLLRPFYVDMGNGMLVEAGSVAEQGRLARRQQRNGEGQTERPSPYRNRERSASTGQAERVPPARAVPQPRMGQAVQPASSGTPVAAPEVSLRKEGAENFAMSGDVPVISTGSGALNTGNRSTDTLRGVNRNNDTMRGSGSGGAESPLSGTVSLNASPYSGPSKLDNYEGRVSGRAASAPSRLSQARPEATVRPAQSRSERTPVARPTPAPSPSSPARRQGIYTTGGTVPAATYVSPPSLPVGKQRLNVDERVFTEMADAEARELGRPLVVPIAVAIPKQLLNFYSISRLARGLWIDPRNIIRNATDISQTLEAVVEVAEVVTTDEGARGEALRRLKLAANSPLSENIIFHYTIWPFVKPIIDLLDLPSLRSSALNTPRKVTVRRARQAATGIAPAHAGDNLPDMGPMVGQEKIQPASVEKVAINNRRRHTAPPAPAASEPVSFEAPGAAPAEVHNENAPDDFMAGTSDEALQSFAAMATKPPAPDNPSGPLNTGGTASKDPTAGMEGDDAGPGPGPEPKSPKSKLGDLD